MSRFPSPLTRRGIMSYFPCMRIESHHWCTKFLPVLDASSWESEKLYSHVPPYRRVPWGEEGKGENARPSGAVTQLRVAAGQQPYGHGKRMTVRDAVCQQSMCARIGRPGEQLCILIWIRFSENTDTSSSSGRGQRMKKGSLIPYPPRRRRTILKN